MTRTIKLRFTSEDDYADFLVAMRPYMANIPGPYVETVDEVRAKAVAKICRAQSAPAKPAAAPGPLPGQATLPIFTDTMGA